MKKKEYILTYKRIQTVSEIVKLSKKEVEAFREARFDDVKEILEDFKIACDDGDCEYEGEHVALQEMGSEEYIVGEDGNF